MNKRTNYNRQYSASPIFTAVLSAINSGKSTTYDFIEQKPRSEKYIRSGGLNSITVINNSASDINFYPNQQPEAYFIPASSQYVFTEFDIPNLKSFTVEELSGTNIDANTIRVTAQHRGVDADSLISKAFKKIWGQGSI